LTKEISIIFPNWKFWLDVVLTSLSQMITKSHVKLPIVKPEWRLSGLLVICLIDLVFWQISFSCWVVLNHALELLGVCEFEIETVFLTWVEAQVLSKFKKIDFMNFCLTCYVSACLFFRLKYRSVESLFAYKIEMRCNDNFLSWSF
jgi:hypothetical protein